MEETGTVVGVKDGTAVVSTQAKGVCHSCSARGICHMSGQKDRMEVEAWNRLDAAVGDQVLIRISGRSTLKAALLLYLVPLLGFLLGVFVGQSLTGHQVWAVVIGLVFLAAVYGGIRLLDRRIGRSAQMRPEIVKILVRRGSGSGSKGREETGDRQAAGTSSTGSETARSETG